ncbi:hypothetical protein HanHA300_Chr05g0169311 [Helianthus annuus]|nr:hypothetical protein HanHA300_Chr05g0169311 [Helianthus annuus]KAJ0584014.1 hypothetical protein HanHA89_Chr05g0183431 [Helianthus annuus]
MMFVCFIGDDENTNDMPCGNPTRQLNYEEELSYSLELSDEYAFDDEVGKRLNQMASEPQLREIHWVK